MRSSAMRLSQAMGWAQAVGPAHATGPRRGYECCGRFGESECAVVVPVEPAPVGEGGPKTWLKNLCRPLGQRELRQRHSKTPTTDRPTAQGPMRRQPAADAPLPALASDLVRAGRACVWLRASAPPGAPA